MKKLILFIAVFIGLSLGAVAQKAAIPYSSIEKKNINNFDSHHKGPAAKTNGVLHDSLYMSNVTAADIPTNYFISHTGSHFDSGYVGGTNAFNYCGFAERYDFSSADSEIQVLGVVALFGGRVISNSAKKVAFKVWSVGPIETGVRTTIFSSGFPKTILDSTVVPLYSLGIRAAADTYKAYYFADPTYYLTSSFFVGYTISYTFSALAGDTIGLKTTRLNHRNSPEYTVSLTDTTINNQNTTLIENRWYDNATDLGFNFNYYIFPIVNSKWSTVGVKGISRKSFTWYGTYPNPATNTSNVRFSLLKSSNITIQLMDMAGHNVKTISQSNLSAGEHIIPMDCSNVPNGDYLMIIHTAEGDGIASKMSVLK